MAFGGINGSQRERPDHRGYGVVWEGLKDAQHDYQVIRDEGLRRSVHEDIVWEKLLLREVVYVVLLLQTTRGYL
jgi:hypothetical protein